MHPAEDVHSPAAPRVLLPTTLPETTGTEGRTLRSGATESSSASSTGPGDTDRAAVRSAGGAGAEGGGGVLMLRESSAQAWGLKQVPSAAGESEDVRPRCGARIR